MFLTSEKGTIIMYDPRDYDEHTSEIERPYEDSTDDYDIDSDFDYESDNE